MLRVSLVVLMGVASCHAFAPSAALPSLRRAATSSQILSVSMKAEKTPEEKSLTSRRIVIGGTAATNPAREFPWRDDAKISARQLPVLFPGGCSHVPGSTLHRRPRFTFVETSAHEGGVSWQVFWRFWPPWRACRWRQMLVAAAALVAVPSRAEGAPGWVAVVASAGVSLAPLLAPPSSARL